MASDYGGASSQVIWIDKGMQVMASSPTESEWFTYFMTDLWSRIGELRNQDAEISITLMIKMQRLLELEWHMEVKQNNKECIRTSVVNVSIQIFTYCGSLRGYETPKFLLYDINHQISSPEESAMFA